MGEIHRSKDSPADWLKGKSALVIGGTGGIGAEITRLLTQSGVQAEVASRSSDQYVDVTDEKSIESLFANISQRFGKVNILIFCVGLLIKRRIDEMRTEEWDWVYNTNLRGAFFTLKHLHRILKPHGRAIFIGSSSYSLGREDYAAYSSSKAALILSNSEGKLLLRI